MLSELKTFSEKFSRLNIPECNLSYDSSELTYFSKKYSLHSFTLGSNSPHAPTLILVGGVHGLERIGSQVCYYLLQHFTERACWDLLLQRNLKSVRMIFIPLANPYGYHHFKRSNGNGVDLMRNSPINSEEKVPYLIGGHRISNRLPWFRGAPGQIELENQFIESIYKKYTSSADITISVDFHSGFGLRDRLWFPFSHSKKEFDYQAQVDSLVKHFTKSYPHHVYQIEPQGHSYYLHGDLWDYLFLQNRKKVFIPFTLEMGSWNWVKKNPLQLFSPLGLYNPIKRHRISRTFRRHHLLIDFLLRSLYSHESLFEK